MSKVGGLGAILYEAFYVFGWLINDQVIIGQIIKHLYFINANKDNCSKTPGMERHYDHIRISVREYICLRCTRKLSRS